LLDGYCRLLLMFMILLLVMAVGTAMDMTSTILILTPVLMPAWVDEVTRGVLPFMAAQFALLFLLVLFPAIVTVPAKWLSG